MMDITTCIVLYYYVKDQKRDSKIYMELEFNYKALA